MSAKRYALVADAGLVVNIIVGDLNQDQEAAILAAQRGVNGAQQIIALGDTEPAWIGGLYADGVFAAPEEPTIVEGTSEVLPQPEPEN